MKKVDKFDVKAKRNSDGCPLELPSVDYKPYDSKNWQFDEAAENDFKDDWSTPTRRTRNESESGLADSPIITDVHSHEDEVSWESDLDDDEVGSDSGLQNNFFNKGSSHEGKSTEDCYPTKLEADGRSWRPPSVDSEKENAPTSDSTAFSTETSFKKSEIDTRSGRVSVSSDVERMAPCPLVRPVVNTTSKYSADVEKLKRQSFEKDVLNKGKLKDTKLQAKIEGKVRPHS